VLYILGCPGDGAGHECRREDVMRDGQKYLPEQYRRRIAFFPGAQWDRRQAPNGDLGRDPNTPHEMMADMAQEGIDLAFLTIPYVLGWVGEDNILYASDYPHWDSEWPHTVDELMKRDDLNARVKAKILGQNALRFYDLKAPLSR